ncbi:MAG: hypothetical protein NTW62_00335 [Candidatus Nomurabacteria bacterium]|nr:hypothetical protein [Candidatus Nomurabacteria bacterium]
MITDLLSGLFLKLFIFLWPIAVTFFLGHIAWTLWKHYIKTEWISGIKWIVLEVKPPRDVLRSPKAMELFFTNALYQIAGKDKKSKYWKGAVRLWFSLEIISIDGQVHFYIRIPSRLKGLVETQMYAQYPQAQIVEVDDYTLAVPYVGGDSGFDFWGCEWKLTKSDVYPIKTYVDFGLDKDPKEEFKVDPMSPLIELFGSIQKGEQMWLQIVIRANDKKYHTAGTYFDEHDLLKEAQNEITKITKDFTGVDANNKSKDMKTAPWQKDVVPAITSKVTKLTFETGIRLAYVAKKEDSNGNNKKNLRLIFRQYDTPHLNSFARTNGSGLATFFQIFQGNRFFISKKTRHTFTNAFFNAYRERAFFYMPLRQKKLPFPFSLFTFKYNQPNTFVLNTEELATLWHFPGQILKVPGLERVESKQASPPPNLPI